MAVAKSTAKTQSTEVAKVNPQFSSEALSEITSFEGALQLLADTYGEQGIAIAHEVLGDGFAMLENKDRLIDVPFVIISWDFSVGTHGEFCYMKLVTETGQKFVVTDGSTGICKDLSEYSAKSGRYGALLVKNGLRRSDYKYDDDGVEKDASTYYLNTSA